MSRTERLLNLTSALLNASRPLSADELQQTIPGYPADRMAFRRQFERDKDALRQLGLPLTVIPIPGAVDDNHVGYRIRQEEYFVRDPGLEPDELSALHLAAQMVRLGGSNAAAGLWKLGLTPSDAAGLVEAANTPAADGPLPALFQAIADRRRIEFTYRGDKRSVSGRQLTFRNGHWYLAAFDHVRNDDRSFRVDRIDGVVSLGKDEAEAPPPPQPEQLTAFASPWELGSGAAVEAFVRIDAPHALWARDRLGTLCVSDTHSDGGLTFRFWVRNVDAFRSFVLGFLDHAEIVSPATLREDLLRWIDAGAIA